MDKEMTNLPQPTKIIFGQCKSFTTNALRLLNASFTKTIDLLPTNQPLKGRWLVGQSGIVH